MACLGGGWGHVALVWQEHDKLPLRSYFLKTVLIMVGRSLIQELPEKVHSTLELGMQSRQGMKNAIRKYWKEGNCRERVAC